MYKNRIRRATPKLCQDSHPKFFIRRPDVALEKRVRYIESVCQVLIESRFGPGRVEPVVINFSDRPELESAVFFDQCDGSPNGLVPCYSLSPHGRAGYQVIEAAYRRVKQMGLADAVPNVRSSTAALTPNQGRGSPSIAFSFWYFLNADPANQADESRYEIDPDKPARSAISAFKKVT
jgi:hypothetical protein